MPPRVKSTWPSVITANPSAIPKPWKIASLPASHARTQRAHSSALAALPTPATGLNPPSATTKPARMWIDMSSRLLNSWKTSNLLSERLHRRRKHIHADHIDQLDPQQECLHVGLLWACLQILQRPVQFLLILGRDVLHQRQAIRR